MKETIGSIGYGNMAEALLGGMRAGGRVLAEQIVAFDPAETRRQAAAAAGIETAADNVSVARRADILLLAVKPNMVAKVCGEIRGELRSETVVLSIAAGVSMKDLAGWLGEGTKIVRVMPNTAALVNEAMCAYCVSASVTDEEKALAESLLSCCGLAEEVSEKLMDTVTGISGSSPAYTYMYIEALADGAVAEGMPRAQAYRFAAQAVLGAAKMVLETGQHPGA